MRSFRAKAPVIRMRTGEGLVESLRKIDYDEA
jgi:hypothetical protein